MVKVQDSELRRPVLAIGVGFGFAVMLVVSGYGLHPGANTSSNFGGPLFAFQMALVSQQSGPSGFEYTLGTVWITNVSFTLDWIQFYIFNGTGSHSMQVTVQVTAQNGSFIGLYNSSLSTWQGSATMGNQSMSTFGGWVSGGSQNFSSRDLYVVTSDRTLASSAVQVGIGLPGLQNQREVESLSL